MTVAPSSNDKEWVGHGQVVEGSRRRINPESYLQQTSRVSLLCKLPLSSQKSSRVLCPRLTSSLILVFIQAYCKQHSMQQHDTTEMHESTEYHNNFSRAFPEATPHSTSFELRQSDPPPPELEVILVTGNTNSTTQSICARFAKDFGFYHIDVPRRLRDLAEDDAFNEPVIGSLHPLGLRHYIATGKNVPAFFVLQFLHYGVDDGVKRGRTKFMYSGLDEDAETAMGFSKKVSCSSLSVCG